MAVPYFGEIRMFAGSFAPDGWLLCNGQELIITEHETLFQLIGTSFGGDGQVTFAVPDLRGRIPIHTGTSPSGTPHPFAESSGSEQETLTVNQLPPHAHRIATSAVASKTSPVANLPGDTGVNLIYADGAGAAIASPSSTVPAGGTQPHDNLMPFLCVNFIICDNGIFPSET
jgi:microcystin-dependent protein